VTGVDSDSNRELARLLDRRMLRAAFQPVVDLESGKIAGYEALIRGPLGSPLNTAGSLLAAAYRANRVIEFDWVARYTACKAAIAAGLNPKLSLFLNVEPLALDSVCPPDLWPYIEQAFGMFPVVLEVTERSLARDPASFLDGLDRQRRLVAGFALDDVGSNLMTLSMLPLVAPAVIKLDMQVTQARPSSHVARVLDLIHEEAERTGATILAEGIETQAHLGTAHAYGATLGQGYHFGPPVSPSRFADEGVAVALRVDTAPTVATPFEALGSLRTARASSELLATLNEQMASCMAVPPGVLLTHVPDPALFGPLDRVRFSELAGQGVVTAVLGPGIPRSPAPGVRGPASMEDGALTGQWATVALSACSAGAMLARDAGTGDDFEFAVTHNRRQVIAAARCLLRRVEAVPKPVREHDSPPG
jgi:EAL domain-containing protein (putative c-di-GMP-specific phosphodiesterase class I)